MTDEMPYHLRADVAAIHRSIGHFITAFAVLDRDLRLALANFFSGEADALAFDPEATGPLLDILLDRMTAGRLQSAFLAMSSAVAELDEADREVRDVLGSMLRFFVRLRNNIAHAYWDVGWEDAETGEPVLPSARVVRVSKDGPAPQVLDSMDADRIEREASRLHTVGRLVRIYVESCLALRAGDASARPSRRLRIASTGEPIGRVLVAVADSSGGDDSTNAQDD